MSAAMFGFLKMVFPLALFAIIYKLVAFVPPNWWGTVDPSLLQRWEETLFFGFSPAHFFRDHHCWVLDLICAGFYFIHFWIFFLFAIYLWKKKFPGLLHCNWAFLVMNLASFGTEILLPTAPPWYVFQHGFALPASLFITGNAAGLLRADQWLGIHFFEHLYAQSSIVFGAFPSMHAAWPVLMLCYAKKLGEKWLLPALWIYLVGIWFAAVYLGHHFIVDLLGGAIYALLAYAVLELRRKQT